MLTDLLTFEFFSEMSTPRKNKRSPVDASLPVVRVKTSNVGKVIAVGRANNVYVHAESLPDCRTSDAELFLAFAAPLKMVAKDCSELMTRGYEFGGDTHSKPLLLANVYVALETKTQRSRSSGANGFSSQNLVSNLVYTGGWEPLSALNALLDPDTRRVVLVGEPGSGKSTFLQYVTLCLAEQVCARENATAYSTLLEVPQILRDANAIPLRVLLRDFAQVLDLSLKCSSESVVAYLGAILRNASHKKAADCLPEVLQRGLAFVMFDGLDEVPKAQLEAVKEAIVGFSSGAYSSCRIAVSCRTESYRKPKFSLRGFPRPHEVAPLSCDMQAKFVDAWYRELGRVQPQFNSDATACAVSLRKALFTERLRDMAGNPFFLTAMAALHRVDRPLPDTGAELMDSLVKGVLEESRKRSGTDNGQLPELAALLSRVKDGFGVLRLRLEAVAFDARVQRQNRAARVITNDMLRSRLLLDKHVDGEWLDKLMDALLHRAGLLQSPDGECYQFAYRFEEFLAGCYLANRDAWEKKEPSFAKRTLDMLGRQGEYARQVVIWAAGVNAHVRRDRSPVRDLVSALVPETCGGTVDFEKLKLAADIACDVGMDHWQHVDVPDVEGIVHRLRTRLEEIRGSDTKAKMSIRVQAASAIGRLGDSRVGVGLKEGLPDIDFNTLPMPAGMVKLSENEENVRIGHSYRISRYPVTVAQFDAFVNAKGYDLGNADTKRWWGKQGLAWLREEGVSGPKTYLPVFQTPNHPQVGVNWYEASAFCSWLTDRLRESGRLKDDETIRLPSEAEWSQAARWNKDLNKADARALPWGIAINDTNLAAHCNMLLTDIGSTSAVGLFPRGTSGCGAMDMAGNVWEWCENKYNRNEDYRVLRGGSWKDAYPEYLSCSYRNLITPGTRSIDFGFRCVLVGSHCG